MANLTKDQVTDIIKNAPSGSNPAGIVSALRAKGHTLEGFGESTIQNASVQNQSEQPNKSFNIQKGIQGVGEAIGGLATRIGSNVKQEFQRSTEIAGEAREKFKQGEIIEGAGKTFSAGTKAIMSPISGVFEGISEPGIKNAITSVQQKWKETASAEDQAKMKDIISKTSQGFDNLPSEVKTALQVAGALFEVGTLGEGSKIATKAGTEAIETAMPVVKKGIELISEKAPNIAKKGTNIVKEGIEQGAKMSKKGSEIVDKIGTGIKERKMMISDAKNEVDTAVGQIIQGKPKDISKATKALSNLDTTGVKTYDELNTVAKEKISALSNKMDEYLAQDTTLRKIDELSKTSTVGNKKVSQNFVEESLNNLEELYEKTSSLEDLARVQNIKEKALNEGLNSVEINNIAKEYGTEFGTKAFNKVGDPLTSVNAVKYENIRKGIKNTVRDFLPDDTAKAIDMSISDLYTVDKLTKKMVEKVNALTQKVQERGIIEKITRMTGKAVNTALLGSPKAFLTSFLPSNIGNKVLNSLDIESMLSKNLKKLQLMDKASDTELIKFVKKADVKANIEAKQATKETIKSNIADNVAKKK